MLFHFFQHLAGAIKGIFYEHCNINAIFMLKITR